MTFSIKQRYPKLGQSKYRNKKELKFGKFYSAKYLRKLFNKKSSDSEYLSELILRILYGISYIKRINPQGVLHSCFMYNENHTALLLNTTSAPISYQNSIEFVKELVNGLGMSTHKLVRIVNYSDTNNHVDYTHNYLKRHHIMSFGNYAANMEYTLPDSLPQKSSLVDSNNVSLGIPKADDKRTKLAQLNDGKKHQFTATFIELGKSKNSYTTSLLRPVLLRNIMYKGKIVTQHAWMSDMKVHHIKRGTQISFRARVYLYMKDFNSNNAKDTSFAVNYGLQNPEHIQVI